METTKPTMREAVAAVFAGSRVCRCVRLTEGPSDVRVKVGAWNTLRWVVAEAGEDYDPETVKALKQVRGALNQACHESEDVNHAPGVARAFEIITAALRRAEGGR